MHKLLRLLVAVMIVSSVAVAGCSGQQGERDENRGTQTEEDVTTMTPEGGTTPNDGTGGTDTDQGAGDTDQENEGPKSNGGTGY